MNKKPYIPHFLNKTMKFNKLIPELIVSDIQKSLDFYKKLGFKLEYERKEDKFAFFSLEGSQLMIEQGKVTGGKGICFQIQVKNVKKILEKTRQLKARIKQPLKDRWLRKNNSLIGMRCFQITDPDGYLLMFLQSLGIRKP